MAPLYMNSSAQTDTSWAIWVGGTSATNTVVDSTWLAWSNGINLTYTDSNTIWITWTDGVSGTAFTPPAALTAEQIEQQRLAAEARQRELAEARERATTLLRDCLDRKQRREFAQSGYFHVETKDGTRRYRLKPGSAPVRVQGEDGKRWSYCIHPDYGYPPEDTALAHKLLLETDEEAFLRIANASAMR